MIDVDVDYISKYFNSDVQSVRSYLGVFFDSRALYWTFILRSSGWEPFLNPVRVCGSATEQTS